jgi:hypothetical protein
LSVEADIAKNRKRYEFNDWLDWDEIQRTAKTLEEADDLLLRGEIDIEAPDAARNADIAEQYDFGELGHGHESNYVFCKFQQAAVKSHG